jgi:hypothetical protein
MEQSMQMKAQKSQVKQGQSQSQGYSYPEGQLSNNYQPRYAEYQGQYVQENQEDARGRQTNNENMNPYMQDTAFQSQIYDMRR